MPLASQKRLFECLAPLAGATLVADVRIGLGYTVVRLADGHAGVAWTPKTDAPCCTHLSSAGTLAGQKASELLGCLMDEKSALARAVGLATANALLASRPLPSSMPGDVIPAMGVTSADRVAMVGYFGPIVAELKKIGCHLDIIELNSHHAGTLTPDEGRGALAACSVALLTGTSLVNGTCDELLSSLGTPRAAVLLGPSSPMCPQAFAGTGITHIAGSRVRNAEAVLRIASEGGGTPILKKHMDFVTIIVKP